jgi:putative FmdB family regulatory protein
MPTYDYECRSCGHTTEVFQNISDEPLVTCPSCGKDELKRLISAGVGIIFKGSGFYVTDSKKSGSNGSSKSKESEKKSDGGESSTGKAAESKSSDSSSAKSESKSGAKAET